MLDTVTHNFEIASRNHIDEFCEFLAQAIKEVIGLYEGKEIPKIIIAIDGEDNIGKSSLWDGIRQHLLVHGGIFIKNKSSSSEKGGIVYESWIGSADNHEIRLFACNVGALFSDYMGEFSIHHLVEEVSDVIIVSKSVDDFISSREHSMNIQMTRGQGESEWSRVLTIEMPATSTLRASSILMEKLAIS